MRQIHPVGFQEKFVASGVYTHYRNAEPTGLIESWKIHQLPDNSHLVRIDWDGRKDRNSQSSMLLEVWYAPGKPGERLERLEVYAYAAPGDPIKVVKASYTFFEDFIQINRKLHDRPPIIGEQIWSPDWVVHPAHVQLLVGFAIARFALQAGTPVKTFYYQAHFNDLTAFQPDFCEEIVRFVAEDELVLANKSHLVRRYEWLSPDNDLKPASIVWLDEYNILMRYLNLSVDSSVILTQYAHRPEPQLP